jgi:amino acid adenylation domain-containing protein
VNTSKGHRTVRVTGRTPLARSGREDVSAARSVTTSVRTLPEQIAEVRCRYPHSMALRSSDRYLSYEDLDRRADEFAGYLAQCGVESGGTVAICMERSFEWIVAALGVMRAGAAYVPLDLAWPDSRLRFAVKDSGAAVLVARGALFNRLHVKASSIDPYRDAAAIAETPTMARRPVPPDSVAYVIYTSGSTGVPKGVEITHANLAHLMQWHRAAFKVTQQDRASHLAGLGFDAAVWELRPHLSAGATVCLSTEEARTSPSSLQQWMIRERLTIAFVPTLYAMAMIEMDWPATTPLRLLLTGGDVLHRGPNRRIPFDVVNNYGPTECTVVATSALLKPCSPERPTIGKPITGVSVYLLDESGEPVPDGIAGEIYIGGDGVGRGYRNLPDSTDRSFVPDPFRGTPGSRMYRTGDRGIRRLDGEIEFHGRLDRQTKVRGQRVELDEISSILIQQARIEFATAVTNVGKSGESQLVAYVLPKKDAPVPAVHELRKHLLRRLPEYMMPDIFVRLDSLPLSANGKLDLMLLPKPTDANLLQEHAVNVPAVPVKEKLLAMIRVLLENPSFRAEDSFFLAGGHSLLGMQLVMRTRVAFGVDLTLRQLFEAPTVERLALLIENRLAEECLASRGGLNLPPGVVALQPRGSRDNIFWIHTVSADLAAVIGDDQPFFSVLLTPDDFSSLGEKATLQGFAACLLRKIRTVQSKGPYTIGGYCLGGLLAWEIASQLRTAGQQMSLLVLLDSPNPAYMESCNSLTRKVNYLRYALSRAARLGPRVSLNYLCDHLVPRFARTPKTNLADSEMRAALQAAALAYRPERYEGEVLLLMASDRPPHANFLPGWQAVVPGSLHVQYVDGHHRDLLKGENARSVADAIASRLAFAADQEFLGFCADRPGQPSQVRADSPPKVHA